MPPTSLAAAGATAAVAIAVKLMDDGLDRERDLAAGFPNWAAPLGRGAPAYALLALAVGCALSPARAAPLFLAAYAIGMGRGRERQPSGLPGWLEGMAALAISVALFGLVRAAASAAAIAAVQLTDGLLDWRADAGYRPVPLPVAPLAGLAAAAWAAALALDPLQAGTVAVCGCGIALATRHRRG